MARLLLLLVVLVVLVALSGSVRPRPRSDRKPNLLFILQDNYYAWEAVEVYATALCDLDQAQDETPEEWKAAGLICQEKWHEYYQPAYDAVTRACAEARDRYEVCR